ncbi:uncharacterized protein [Chelonus insularis]|uniref:uncharacterized protein n=1 Tax=Chelonus insularis TaxID=460826 RepID=UPI00158C17F7|nr:uncharacterized protein LOC118070955 [Chelonus insularis]
MELLVPTISDVVFKYSWLIKNYKKTIAKKSCIDSPPFDLKVNGIFISWNLSIRFWKNPEGKRIKNPIVLCLNILNCGMNDVEQIKIRFQFAVFNAELNSLEYCHVSRTILELKSTSNIISLGYRDLSIFDRHLQKNGELTLMVKIQLVQSESEKQCLTQDIPKSSKHSKGADTRLMSDGNCWEEMPALECK